MGGSFEDMRGAVGSLIWLWVAIEKQARQDLARMNAEGDYKGGRGLAPLLDAWAEAVANSSAEDGLRKGLTVNLRARLQGPLMVRHGVCHGLDGLQAAQGDEPGWLSWTLSGKAGRKTWEELQGMFAWMSKVPFAMQILSATGSGPFSRFPDTAENRDWWRDEYGIDASGA